MRFSLVRPVKIVMIGTGGTGGHIAPDLYRLLYALDRPIRFIVCDGDITEEKNLIRQNFTQADVGENKARAVAERYSNAFGLETSYVPHFIESREELQELVTPQKWTTGRQIFNARTGRHEPETVSEMVILIGAVDNNRSRLLCHEVFMEAKDLIYIDSGNGEYTGQVVCGIRQNGKTIYKPVGLLYPEDLASPDDQFPSELSCADASVSAPQTIIANRMAATAVMAIVYNILVLGNSTVEQSTFSTKSVNIRSVNRRPKRRKAA